MYVYMLYKRRSPWNEYLCNLNPKPLHAEPLSSFGLIGHLSFYPWNLRKLGLQICDPEIHL